MCAAIVVYADKVVMRDTLKDALAAIFGEAPDTQEQRPGEGEGGPGEGGAPGTPTPTEPGGGAVASSVQSLLTQADTAFAEADSVEVIFLDYGSQRRLHKAAVAMGIDDESLAETLQYPRGSKANLGRVRHSPGHEGHIHVRFACGDAEPECG